MHSCTGCRWHSCLNDTRGSGCRLHVVACIEPRASCAGSVALYGQEVQWNFIGCDWPPRELKNRTQHQINKPKENKHKQNNKKQNKQTKIIQNKINQTKKQNTHHQNWTEPRQGSGKVKNDKNKHQTKRDAILGLENLIRWGLGARGRRGRVGAHLMGGDRGEINMT